MDNLFNAKAIILTTILFVGCVSNHEKNTQNKTSHRNLKDDVPPIGKLTPMVFFSESLDTNTSYVLISYKINGEKSGSNITASSAKKFDNRRRRQNIFGFCINDTLYEKNTYEIVMKINDKTVKNTYSDLTFDKRWGYQIGWFATLSSYKKNGELTYAKMNELNW